MTSSGPSEGKSTTSANLAVVFASSGQRVLLVDADMRKPTVHKTFGLRNDTGLSLVLSTNQSVLENARTVGIENLSILPSGPKAPNPSELLGSVRMNQVIDKVAELQAELDRRNLPLTLLEGQEVRITGDLVEEIQQDQILFTDLADTYLLIEFPTMDVPAYTEQLFFKLRNMGKVPVIVHPERNAKFREDPNRLIPYLEMGCLAQLTAPSYIGVFGKDIQKTAKQMVEHNLVQMMASDAHGIKKRTFAMKEAFRQIGHDFDEEKVKAMEQVAKDLINGDAVTYPDYTEVKKKRFGLF